VAGAGEALWAGEILTGADIMTHSGVVTMVLHIMAAVTGVIATERFTEEAVAEDSVILV
jgi:hypothetical protein